MRRRYNGILKSNPLVLTIDTTLGDGIASFKLPTRIGYNYKCKVDWGDSTESIITTFDDPNITHTYAVGGVYTVSIYGVFEAIYFNNSGDKDKFTRLEEWGDIKLADFGLVRAFLGCTNATYFNPIIPYVNVTSLLYTWSGCSSAVSFPEVNTLVNVTSLIFTWYACSSATIFPDVNNLVNVTNLTYTWFGCSSAVSFPEVNTLVNVTSLQNTWYACSSATSFPSVSNLVNVTNLYATWQNCSSSTIFPDVNNLVNVTSLSYTWRECNSALSFPDVNTLVNVTNLTGSWYACSSATSFPSVSNLIKVTTLNQTWVNCSNHTTVAPNEFNNFIASNYNLAYKSTNLTTQSINNVLTSIDVSGVLNGTFLQSGGQAPSVTAIIDNLRAKGWSITVTGGY